MKIKIEKDFIIKDGIKYVPEIKEEKSQLPTDFTGWCKTNEVGNEKWFSYFEKGIYKYGFDSSGEWKIAKQEYLLEGDECEATESEVFEALKNEAVRRYKNGTTVQCIKSKEHGWKDVLKTIKHDTFDYYSISGDFWVSDENELAVCVFINGKWAEIIETITKEEAEKLLNKKII